VNHRLIDRAALATALLSLGVIGLRPTSTAAVDPRIAVVRTPGASTSEARAVAESLGGVEVIDLAAGGHFGNATTLHLIGQGLDAAELRSAGDRALVLHPLPLPDGIREAHWSGAVTLGEPVEVRVNARSTGLRELVLLSEPGGVDSAPVPPGAPAWVTLRHTPRAAGSARYILRFGEEADTFSVLVGTPHPPATILLASAPDRDWSDLRDWLAHQGGQVTLRTAISRDRSRLEQVNATGAPPLAIDRASLSRVALVVTDGRTLTHLSATERGALRAGVTGGLGLIVLLDRESRDPRLLSPVERAFFFPWRWSAIAELEERQVRPRVRGVPLSATPITAEPVVIVPERFGGEVLIDDGQGGTLAATVTTGSGRIAGSVVTGSGRWAREGEVEAYGSYWNALVRSVAHPGRLDRVWNTGDGPVLLDAERTIALQGAGPSRWRAGEDTLMPTADPLVRGRMVARWWPRSTGWNALDDARVWVSGSGSWETWRAAERRRGTEEWIASHRGEGTAGARLPRRIPWPLWPFFLTFLAAAGWLWRPRGARF
jgi:hypothetical protein